MHIDKNLFLIKLLYFKEEEPLYLLMVILVDERLKMGDEHQ